MRLYRNTVIAEDKFNITSDVSGENDPKILGHKGRQMFGMAKNQKADCNTATIVQAESFFCSAGIVEERGKIPALHQVVALVSILWDCV